MNNLVIIGHPDKNSFCHNGIFKTISKILDDHPNQKLQTVDLYEDKLHRDKKELIEKYKDLAREALSNGDKILSENYLQHADHFTRILNERESYRKEKFSEDSPEKTSNVIIENVENNEENSVKNLEDTSTEEPEAQKSAKAQF